MSSVNSKTLRSLGHMNNRHVYPCCAPRLFVSIYTQQKIRIQHVNTGNDGLFSLSQVSKEPVKLNLLTSQVKLVPDDAGKKCFDLISSSSE